MLTRLCASLCLAGIAQAQEPLRVTTRMVQVNVVARDANGLPVRDLKREDFTVYDEKKKQEVRSFSIEWRKTAAAAAPLPANTYTNRLEQHPDAPTAVTVVLFDEKNTAWDRVEDCKREVVEVLRRADPEHRIALYVLGDKLRVLHDFTGDTQALIGTLAKAAVRGTGGNPAARTGAEPPKPAVEVQVIPADNAYKYVAVQREADAAELQRWLDAQGTRYASLDTRRRVLETVYALEAIAWRLSRVPGRKNLVWVSSVFPFSLTPATMRFGDWRPPDTVREEVERATRALTAASVSVYPVFAGRSPTPPGSAADQGFAPPTAAPDTGSGTEAMRLLADGTGGTQFASIKGLGQAVQQAADDSRITYTLGYVPSHADWNGKFRRIRVEVGRPGVQLRYRSGYAATPDRAETAEERGQMLTDAVWSPLDATGLSVDVRMEPGSKPGALRLMLLLDSQAVALTAGNGEYSGALDVLYVQEAGDGRNVRGIRDEIKLRMNEETRDRLLAQKQVAFRKEIERAEGAVRLRIVVRDSVSGLIGSVTAPL